MISGSRLGVATCCIVLGCRADPVAVVPPTGHSALLVAGEGIPPGFVTNVAAARGMTPREAANAVVSDVLFARHLGEIEPGLAQYLRSVGLARLASERLQREARAAGAATDEELARFTERHWWQLDRPLSIRVTHAVVVAPEGSDRVQARRVADRLWERIHEAADQQQFRELASAHDGAGFQVEIEDLSPVTPDGRVIDLAQPPLPGQAVARYDERFAVAAHALGEVGKISGVIETRFGFHVLLVTERVEEVRLDADRRRQLLQPEIERERARAREQAVLSAARARARIEIDTAALSWTERIQLGR